MENASTTVTLVSFGHRRPLERCSFSDPFFLTLDDELARGGCRVI